MLTITWPKTLVEYVEIKLSSVWSNK